MARKGKKAVTLEEKVKENYPEFYDSVAGLSVSDLMARLSTYAKGRSETEEARKNDPELQKAKEDVKEAGAPYREALAEITLKSNYLVALAKEKGGA